MTRNVRDMSECFNRHFKALMAEDSKKIPVYHVIENVETAVADVETADPEETPKASGGAESSGDDFSSEFLYFMKERDEAREEARELKEELIYTKSKLYDIMKKLEEAENKVRRALWEGVRASRACVL